MKKSVPELSSSEVALSALCPALSEAQASDYISVARATLRRQRSKNAETCGIPIVPWVKYGARKVVYLRKDLDRWLELRAQETRR